MSRLDHHEFDLAAFKGSIRNLKRYRLRSLVDLLFGGLGKFPHTLFLYETLVRLSYWDELTNSLLVRPYYDA